MTAKRAKKSTRSAPAKAKSSHKPAAKSAAKTNRKGAASSPRRASAKPAKPVGKSGFKAKSKSSAPKRKVAVAKPAPKRAAPAPVVETPLVQVVRRALDDIKAVNVKVLDVRGITDFADTLVIASGNSDRHVKSIADRVVEFAKQAGFRPMGVEGERDGEWVLVDLSDVIVHVMLPRVREFYRLENLWDIAAASREVAEQ
jgi:ribosome-associated protein